MEIAADVGQHGDQIKAYDIIKDRNNRCKDKGRLNTVTIRDWEHHYVTPWREE
jgi:hypothetical protein